MLKVGIAGYGVVGKDADGVLMNNPHLKFAICDRAFDQKFSHEDDLYKYSDYRDMLSQDLDIIIICLTNEIAPVVTIEV